MIFGRPEFHDLVETQEGHENQSLNNLNTQRDNLQNQTRQKVYKLKQEVEDEDFKEYLSAHKSLLNEFAFGNREFNYFEKIEIKNCLVLAKLLLLRGSDKEFLTDGEIQRFHEEKSLESIIDQNLLPLFGNFYLECPVDNPIQPLDVEGNPVHGYFSDRFLRMRIDFINQPVVQNFVHLNQDGSRQESKYIRVKEFVISNGSPLTFQEPVYIPMSSVVASKENLNRLKILELKTNEDILIEQAYKLDSDLRDLDSGNLNQAAVNVLIENFQDIPVPKQKNLTRIIAINYPDIFFSNQDVFSEILNNSTLYDFACRAVSKRKFEFFKHISGIQSLNLNIFDAISVSDMDTEELISFYTNYKSIKKHLLKEIKIPSKRMLKIFIQGQGNKLEYLRERFSQDNEIIPPELLEILNLEKIESCDRFNYEMYTLLKHSQDFKRILQPEIYARIYRHSIELLDTSNSPRSLIYQSLSIDEFNQINSFLTEYSNIAYFIKNINGINKFNLLNLDKFKHMQQSEPEYFELYYFINYMYSELYLNKTQILQTSIDLVRNSQDESLRQFAAKVYIGMGGLVSNLTNQEIIYLETISSGSAVIDYSNLLTEENHRLIVSNSNPISVSVYFSMLIAIKRSQTGSQTGSPSQAIQEKLNLYNRLSNQAVFLNTTLILSHETGDSQFSVLRESADGFDPSDIISLASRGEANVSSIRFDDTESSKSIFSRIPEVNGDLTLYIGAHGSPGRLSFGNTGRYTLDNLYESLKQYLINSRPEKPKLNLIFTSCYSGENSRRLISKIKNDQDLNYGEGYDIMFLSSSNDRSSTYKVSTDSWGVENRRPSDNNEEGLTYHELFTNIEPRGFVTRIKDTGNFRERVNSNFTLFTLDGEQF